MNRQRGTRFGARARGMLAVAAPAVGLALALSAFAPAGQALAQQNAGGTINIGGNIANTVAGAVSGIASSSHASGGVQSSHSEMELGEQEGLAISDASGGNRNASVTSK
jgi:hypothetical protein